MSGTNSFLNNHAQDHGGGMYVLWYNTVEMSGTNSFSNNTAQSSGGGMLVCWDSTVEMSGTNSFSNNHAQEDGGGMLICWYNTVEMSGTNSFSNNTAQSSGGGMFVSGYNTARLNGTNSFMSNFAQHNGGGMYIITQMTLVGDTSFAANSASRGVAIYTYSPLTFIGKVTSYQDSNEWLTLDRSSCHLCGSYSNPVIKGTDPFTQCTRMNTCT